MGSISGVVESIDLLNKISYLWSEVSLLQINLKGDLIITGF